MPDAALGLAVALGAGLLIGIERERHKGRGDDRRAAGLRSFMVAALTGALAQSQASLGLVAIGALLVVLLAATAYWKSRSRDPGMTTELALLATYLIGVQAIMSPALAAACAAGLAALLAARARLHHLANTLLTDRELHDALVLAALALIVLPLVPIQPIEALGGMQPRPLVAMVLLIMGIQAGGQLALRWLGPQRGLLASGFVAGFVSSTATVASLGSHARAEPAQAAALAGAAVLSAAATWVQALLISAALSPSAALALLPAAGFAALGCAAVGVWMVQRADVGVVASGVAADTDARSALRPREAIIVATMLGVVATAIGLLQQRFGNMGLGAGVALAALVDAHAPIASLAALHAAGTLATPTLVGGALLSVSANTLVRCIVAAVAGGRDYGLRVAASLLASAALAWATAWMSGGV
jgi:uncharacterized membrane protein (DUF4010 family)